MSAFRRRPAVQSERRSAPRTELRVEVILESDLSFYYGVTHNLAEGGLFVSTYEHVPIGTELTVHLTLPEKVGLPISLALRGRVHWVREHSPLNQDMPPGIGLQLLAPEPGALATLRRLLDGQEPTFYE